MTSQTPDETLRRLLEDAMSEAMEKKSPMLEFVKAWDDSIKTRVSDHFKPYPPHRFIALGAGAVTRILVWRFAAKHASGGAKVALWAGTVINVLDFLAMPVRTKHVEAEKKRRLDALNPLSRAILQSGDQVRISTSAGSEED